MNKKQELHPSTALVNKLQKKQSKKSRSDAELWLKQTFPQLFDNPSRILPFKVGIMEDILEYYEKNVVEPMISKTKLKEAVASFARSYAYLVSLKFRESRVDLFGKTCVEVTEEEAEAAALKLRKRIEKSMKNSRKTKSKTSYSAGYLPQEQNMPSAQNMTEQYMPTYPHRGVPYGTQSAAPQVTKTTTVVSVTHKTAKQIDPSAVARLKAKLGLSLSAEKEKVDD